MKYILHLKVLTAEAPQPRTNKGNKDSTVQIFHQTAALSLSLLFVPIHIHWQPDLHNSHSPDPNFLHTNMLNTWLSKQKWLHGIHIQALNIFCTGVLLLNKSTLKLASLPPFTNLLNWCSDPGISFSTDTYLADWKRKPVVFPKIIHSLDTVFCLSSVRRYKIRKKPKRLRSSFTS